MMYRYVVVSSREVLTMTPYRDSRSVVVEWHGRLDEIAQWLNDFDDKAVRNSIVKTRLTYPVKPEDFIRVPSKVKIV